MRHPSDPSHSRRESLIPGRSGSLGEQLIDLIESSGASADWVLDPVVLDHPSTRDHSRPLENKGDLVTLNTITSPLPVRERACVYVSCSARAQDDPFQDTTFSIASGFTLTSLRDCSYTYHDQDSFAKPRNHLLFVAHLQRNPPKQSDPTRT